MNKYLIAYIDEEQEDRDAFENYFDEYNEFEVECIFPSGKSIDQVIDEIVELNPDIVVVDYYLKYADPDISDNGDVFVQRINDRKPLLPTLLFTSFIDKAKLSFIPPEKKATIVDKNLISNSANEEFKNRTLDYIVFYRQLIKKYKQEFSDLSLKGELNEKEAGRLKELDNILESSNDRQAALKEKYKSDEKLEKLDELITSTKDLLREIKNERKDA